MNNNFNMYGSKRAEINYRYFVVAVCYENQTRKRRLQTIISVVNVDSLLKITHAYLTQWSLYSNVQTALTTFLTLFIICY